jgi:hypothetical protein
MKLLVSIHDVSPANRAAVLELWTMCRARGITPALFVVPNWHGEWPLPEYPDFVAWLRGCASVGAEIFLHGERHDEQGSVRTLAGRVRAFGVTDSEGEFLSLNEDEVRQRIARGLDVLRGCGLQPIGFVPPAWLASHAWRRIVVEAGLSISEDVESVYLHGRATRLQTPVTRWSTRTGLRAFLSEIVAEIRWLRGSSAPLIRVALHPDDLSSRRVRASIGRTLTHWLEHHHPWGYAML